MVRNEAGVENNVFFTLPDALSFSGLPEGSLRSTCSLWCLCCCYFPRQENDKAVCTWGVGAGSTRGRGGMSCRKLLWFSY